MYRVTYDTPVRPADLPDGAKVEQLPRTYPVTLDTGISRRFAVDKLGSNVFLTMWETDGSRNRIYAQVPPNVARELAHSILEAISDPIPGTPVPPSVVRDNDGDHWVLNPRTGMWKLTYTRTELTDDQLASNVGETLDSIASNYRGYTVVK